MAMKQFLFLYISMVIVSSVTIWSDPMSSSATQSDWTSTATVTQRENSYCPDQVDGPCVSMCNGYIYRTVSTMPYENITLTFDVTPWGMTITDQCVFSYNTDNNIAQWTPFYSIYDSNAFIESHTEALDITTENNIGVSIKIEADGSDTKCCILSNVHLEGTLIAPSNEFVVPPSSSMMSVQAANTLCQSTFGTELATITTFSGNKKATATCVAFCASQGLDASNCACWIGLHRFANQNEWHWQDSAPVQYGFDGSGVPITFAAPWWTDGTTGTDPNVAASSTAYVRMGQVASSWVWGDTTSGNYNPLCNAPTPDPTSSPTTNGPTTTQPSLSPITNEPTTSVPTVSVPTTNEPTTAVPTSNPTVYPITHEPTTATPTTIQPTAAPITAQPTLTHEPTPNEPTSAPATPITYMPTISPTAKPIDGGEVQEMTTTHIYTNSGASEDELKNRNETQSLSLVFIVAGMSSVLCICLCIICLWKKLKDRQRRIKEVKRMQMSVMKNRTNTKTFTTDINTAATNTNPTPFDRVNSTSNIQAMTPSQVTSVSQGINNILMTDVVNDMDGYEDVIQGMTTTVGGPSMDGDMTNTGTETNSTGDVSGDDDMMMANDINNATFGAREGTDQSEYDEQYTEEYGNTLGNEPVNLRQDEFVVDEGIGYVNDNEESDNDLLDYMNATKM